MRGLIERVLQFLLPSQCHCCERFLEEGQKRICPDCLSKIRWIEPPLCTLCGTPFLSRRIENHPCGACLTRRKYFTMARAVGYYEGPLREAIHRWKYEEKSYLTSFFGEKLAEGFRRYWGPGSFDLLVPVPLHSKRLRERGFNQALLLAKELSQRTRIPYSKRLLQKRISTPPQVHLSGRKREKGVKGSFHIQRDEAIKGKTILLVDDVYTTGATVNECSKVLLKAGAERVDVLTVAHAIKQL
ncbi:MAG: ComF family protein [Deltaproteobacteria bacterium]|jgi:ComF family protein|nr:ComF family protein [Deltaproteobacteria bacterium]